MYFGHFLALSSACEVCQRPKKSSCWNWWSHGGKLWDLGRLSQGLGAHRSPNPFTFLDVQLQFITIHYNSLRFITIHYNPLQFHYFLGYNSSYNSLPFIALQFIIQFVIKFMTEKSIPFFLSSRVPTARPSVIKVATSKTSSPRNWETSQAHSPWQTQAWPTCGCGSILTNQLIGYDNQQ